MRVQGATMKQTDDTINYFSSSVTLKLNLHQHLNHLLHLFFDLNDQSSNGPGYL